MNKAFWGGVVLFMIFCNLAVVAQGYDKDDSPYLIDEGDDDIPYLTDEDMAALEYIPWDKGVLGNVVLDETPDTPDMSEDIAFNDTPDMSEDVAFNDTPDIQKIVSVIISEMPRLNASRPVYHLLILDRLHSPLNSDISDTGGLSILYKYRHGRNGYLIALYKTAAERPVFPQLPNKSRVMANLMSVRVNTIREYMQSSAFRRFVTSRRILSDIDAILRNERTGGSQKIASEAKTNEMPRLNASQPIYHLLVLDRLYSPNSDISDTGSISILYKFRHGRNGYLVALYKSTAGGPVFPKFPVKSRVLVDLMSVHTNTLREYIGTGAFRVFVTNRMVLSRLDAVLRGERSGGFQRIASDAIANEMPRLNASQPVYHLLVLDRNPLNADISDTGNIQVLYKYKHGGNGYLIVLYKSAAGGPVFPQLPDNSLVLADYMTVRVSAIRDYIYSSVFGRFVTNRRIISGMDAALLRERK